MSTELLITCDIICHGTPSPLIWKDYLDFIQDKYRDRITNVNFRNKSIGWHKPQLKIEMSCNTQIKTEAQDPFYQLFYSNCILRRSCHLCQYAKTKRVADITMADAWGIEQSHPEWDDNKGLSLLLINSEKGVQIVEQMGISTLGTGLDDIKQPHLYRPAVMSKRRNAFWKNYHERSFIYVLKKYGNYSVMSKLIKKTKRLVLKIINV